MCSHMHTHTHNTTTRPRTQTQTLTYASMHTCAHVRTCLCSWSQHHQYMGTWLQFEFVAKDDTDTGTQAADVGNRRSLLRLMRNSSARLLLSTHDAVLTVDMGNEASSRRVQEVFVSVCVRLCNWGRGRAKGREGMERVRGRRRLGMYGWVNTQEGGSRSTRVPKAAAAGI